MKKTTKINLPIITILIISFCNNMISYTMEIYPKKTLKSGQKTQPIQLTHYKSDNFWLKTSDAVIEIPQWQADQMGALQQKGKNSKNNPANAPMVSSNDIKLIQKMLQTTNNVNNLEKTYHFLSQNQQATVLDKVFSLKMQGLASLLMTYIFPKELQSQMGASALQPAGIMVPVIKYLLVKKNKENVIELQKYLKQTHDPDVDEVSCIAMSPDNECAILNVEYVKEMWLSGASWNAKALLWNKKTNKITTLDSQKINCATFSADGKYVIIGSNDKLILYDGKNGQKIRDFKKPKWPVTCVAFSADNQYIIAGSSEGIFNNPALYDKNGNPIKSLASSVPSFEVQYVAFNPKNNDSFAIVGGFLNAGILRIESAPDSWKDIKIEGSGCTCIQFSPDGKQIAAGFDNGILLLHDVETGQVIKKFKEEELDNPMVCIAFSHNGNYIVSGSKKEIEIWDAKTGLLLQKFKGIASWIMFSADDHSVIYNVKSDIIEHTLDISPQIIQFIATQLNLAQASLLYRLYIAKINNAPVVLDEQEADYHIFKTLPEDVQHIIKTFLPFTIMTIALQKEEMQKKMNEYKNTLFYHHSKIWGKHEKSDEEKVKALKDTMNTLNKNSIEYRACESLLQELELKMAFEA